MQDLSNMGYLQELAKLKSKHFHHRGTEATEYNVFYPIGRRRLDKRNLPFRRTSYKELFHIFTRHRGHRVEFSSGESGLRRAGAASAAQAGDDDSPEGPMVFGFSTESIELIRQ
jgi:hypothetical protein